jgi:DNA anti-recombination protein RmuC
MSAVLHVVISTIQSLHDKLKELKAWSIDSVLDSIQDEMTDLKNQQVKILSKQETLKFEGETIPRQELI